MTDVTGNVVLISADNVRFHVGPADLIADHLEIDANNLADLQDRLPEMYDDRGRPVQFVPSDADTVKLALVDGQDAVDEQLLLDRMTLALALMQVKVHTHVREDLRSYRVPKVDGELQDVVAALAAVFALLGPSPRHFGGNCHDSSTHPHL
jgi:hypothetical protein